MSSKKADADMRCRRRHTDTSSALTAIFCEVGRLLAVFTRIVEHGRCGLICPCTSQPPTVVEDVKIMVKHF